MSFIIVCSLFPCVCCVIVSFHPTSSINRFWSPVSFPAFVLFHPLWSSAPPWLTPQSQWGAQHLALSCYPPTFAFTHNLSEQLASCPTRGDRQSGSTDGLGAPDRPMVASLCCAEVERATLFLDQLVELHRGDNIGKVTEHKNEIKDLSQQKVSPTETCPRKSPKKRGLSTHQANPFFWTRVSSHLWNPAPTDV